MSFPSTCGLRAATRWTALFLAVAAPVALAQEAAPASPASPVSALGMLQVLAGLAVVLALVVGFAWLMRRVGPMQAGGGRLVRVLGGAAVGARERVILVEVSDTWLVVGVAPGQVRALATLPRGEIPAAPASGTEGMPFAEAFRRVLERRREG